MYSTQTYFAWGKCITFQENLLKYSKFLGICSFWCSPVWNNHLIFLDTCFSIYYVLKLTQSTVYVYIQPSLEIHPYTHAIKICLPRFITLKVRKTEYKKIRSKINFLRLWRNLVETNHMHVNRDYNGNNEWQDEQKKERHRAYPKKIYKFHFYEQYLMDGLKAHLSYFPFSFAFTFVLNKKRRRRKHQMTLNNKIKIIQRNEDKWSVSTNVWYILLQCLNLNWNIILCKMHGSRKWKNDILLRIDTFRSSNSCK